MKDDVSIVPANGEMLVWIYPDDDSQAGEQPYVIDQCPIVAWRIITEERHTWGDAVLPAAVDLPKFPKGGLFSAIVMPDGQVYAEDGSESYASVEAFETRWSKFFFVRRDRRLAEEPPSPAEPET